MDNSEWNQRKAAQDDIIRRDLALLRGDKTRWRRHRALEIVCRRCHEPVVEVMTTSTYAAVCYRAAQRDPNEPVDMVFEERLERLRSGANRQELRAGEAMWFPISNDLKAADTGLIRALCECRQHTIGETFVANLFRRGVRRHLI